jgi:6-phosphogluconate dehydrogenase
LHFSILITYAQGLALLTKASKVWLWPEFRNNS